jgi:hypothetical protein
MNQSPCFPDQAHIVSDLTPNVVLSRINDNCKDDFVLFVRKHLTFEDVAQLNNLNNYVVVTSYPSSVNEFNFQKEIAPHVQIINPFPNTIDYIYWKCTLWIFASSNGKGYLWGAIEITNINSEDIDEYLNKAKVIFDYWKEHVRDNNTEVGGSTSLENKDLVLPNVISYEKPPLELYRKEISDLFKELFSEIEVEFRGISVNRKTISLSDFYKKHHIAGEQLSGSWRLFEKATLEKHVDTWAVELARKQIDDAYTIQIKGHGSILYNKWKSDYYHVLNDYYDSCKKYYNGDYIEKIGTVKVSCQCTLVDVLEKSEINLRNYLINTLVNNSSKPYTRQDATVIAEKFTGKEFRFLGYFGSDIELRIKKDSSPNPDMWKDIRYSTEVYFALSEFKKTICQNNNSQNSPYIENKNELLEKLDDLLKLLYDYCEAFREFEIKSKQ